MKKVV